MNESETTDVEFKWTNANLLKLLASMKSSIPKEEKICCYQKGLKTVDWDKVAFPPFSPEDCKNKWGDIMERMRKLRSLTELIVEAEEAISDPAQNRKINPEFPKKPKHPRNAYFMDHYYGFKKKNPGLGTRKIFTLLFKKYDELSDKKKAKYEEKYDRDIIEYKKKMMNFSKQNKIKVRPVRIMPRKRNKKSSEDDMSAKPPVDSNNLFFMEQSEPAEGKSDNEGTNSFSQRWQNLSETERKRNAACLKKVGKSPSKKRWPGEPKMPSQSPYAYFTAEQMPLLKEKVSNSRERFKVLKNLWLQLPMKKKERYQSKVHENLRSYSAELQKWFTTLKPEEQEKYLKENPRKSKFFAGKNWKKCSVQELQLCQPSDSEDEDIDDSSSEEEKISLHDDDDDDYDDEEEEDEDITFDIK